jgi:hypothetical protein
VYIVDDVVTKELTHTLMPEEFHAESLSSASSSEKFVIATNVKMMGNGISYDPMDHITGHEIASSRNRKACAPPLPSI